MYKISLIILLVIGLGRISNAQELTYLKVDSLTYQLLLSKKYMELTTFSQKAIDQGLDSYSLRLRWGIAYYDQEKYFLAQEQFESALKFNSYDALLFEYIYYCYLYTQRSQEALLFADKFPESLKRKLNLTKRVLVNNLVTDMGYFTNSGRQTVIPEDMKTISDENGGQSGNYRLIKQDKNLDLRFIQTAITSKLSPKFYLTNSYGYYYLNKQTTYRYNSKDQSYNYYLNQHDYSLFAKFLFTAKFSIGATYHYCYYTSAPTSAIYSVINKKYSFVSNWVSSSNNISAINFRFATKKGWFEPSYSYSSITNLKVHQLNVSSFYYPFAKSKLYGQSTVSYVRESSNPGLIVYQKIGFPLSKRTSSELAFYYGKLKNFNENNAQIVYNLADNIKLKASLNLFYSASKHLQLNVYSSFLKRENTLLLYNTKNTITTNIINYNQYTIAGGIVWKF